MEINIEPYKSVSNRQTYDFLTYLGDIGGLTDALLLLGKFFMAPFTGFSLQSILLRRLFRMLPSQSHNMVDDNGGSSDVKSQ